MERVGALIHKLKEQYDQNVDKKSLLVTVQLLLAELEHESSENLDKGKVSVVLPKVHRIVQDLPSIEPEAVQVQQITSPEPIQKEKEEVHSTLPETIRSYILKPPPQPIQPAKFISQEEQVKPVVETKEEKAEAPASPVISNPQPEPGKKEQQQSLFETVTEIPTLIHHKEVYELNDVHIDGDSLNDKLKEERKELASTIKGDTVQDLRKAIGINDRYRFINELFRGDEAMYDRSIKTINSFSSLPEAASWIERELKVKLGWNEKNTTVIDFDQVVKRRFSWI